MSSDGSKLLGMMSDNELKCLYNVSNDILRARHKFMLRFSP